MRYSKQISTGLIIESQSGGGTYSFNASAGVRVAGGVMASSITITEISA